MSNDKAIEAAVDSCIKEGVLVDILEKHRLEVTEMLLTEYDEQLHINNEKGISFEEGQINMLDLVKDVAEKLKSGVSKEELINSGIKKKVVDDVADMLDMN